MKTARSKLTSPPGARRQAYLTLSLWLWSALQAAQADLPTPVPPSTNPAAGNWLDLFKGYAKDAGLVLGLVLAIAIFLWVAWATIAKFNEARTGRAEWGEVGLLGVMAAGVMIFTGFLLTEASKVIA